MPVPFDRVALMLRHWLQTCDIDPRTVAVTLRPSNPEVERKLTWALSRDLALLMTTPGAQVEPESAAKVAGIEFRIEPAPRPIRATIG